MKKRYTLLTGATGLLGQYLLKDLLLADVPVAVLVRGTAEDNPEQRLVKLVEELEWRSQRKFSLPVCLAGNIGSPQLGLSESSANWLGEHCSSILHNAASLAFQHDIVSGEPTLTNVRGSENLLAFAKKTGVEDLLYVSTAYVCGNRSGVIFEDELNQGQMFRNVYEQSKHDAELLVRDASKSIKCTVVRPSIIVGDYETGYTSTFHGPYQMMHFTWLVSQVVERDKTGKWLHNVRLNMNGDELRNLVPVDWVSRAIVGIHNNPRAHGRTYHLAPSMPTTTRELEFALATYFQYEGVRFVGRTLPLPDSMSSEIERAFYQDTSRYHDYFRSEPEFNCQNTIDYFPEACPHLDCDVLMRLVDFAVQAKFGRKRERRVKKVPSQIDCS